MKVSSEYANEVALGKRFKFGQNWSRFLSVIDMQRITIAEQSLKEMLEVDTLCGNSFLDIGSGRGGRLFIAIYNDQGRASRYWEKVKRAYNQLLHGFKFLILWPAFVYMWGPIMCRDLLRGKPFYAWLNYGSQRGMDAWTDVVDFIGGYPFEVAKPDEICEFYCKKGFTPLKLKICDGHGCNEYVFVKARSD